MIKSMTAFGRAEQQNNKAQVSVEIQTVNRKYLEVAISLPRQFTAFEPELRRIIRKVIARGRVTATVEIELNAEKVSVIKPNISLAKALLKSYRTLAKELGYKKEIDLAYVLRNRDVIEKVDRIENAQEFWTIVGKTVNAATKEVLKMKMSEGSAIEKDFSARLVAIEKSIKEISKNSGRAVLRYKKRLMDRIKEISGNKLDNEEKILREIAIYAEKSDITEEITRLVSHIKQFKTYMKSRNPVGRTLDFLVQEMHREINTIGSKSNDLKISKVVVVVKSELEKIREQVQNIE